MYIDTKVCAASKPLNRISLLLTTNHLLGWTGSETLILSLIEGLCDNGCEIVVYARYIDKKWVDHYIDNNILITDSLDIIREFNFDLAHVQHSSCLIDVRAVFPKLPIIFSSLGILPFL